MSNTATKTLPEPSWKVVPSPREKATDGDDTWLWVEYKNLPVDSLGHQFTSRWGDGLVDGSIVMSSAYDINQFSAHNTSSCGNCDAYASFDFYDDAEHGPRLVYVNRINDNNGATPCPAADGAEWTVDLAVASGRMIVSDDLRPVYSVPLRHERDVPDYNSILGQMLHCKEQEAIGCAYGPTSNIGLGLYRLTGPDAEQDRYAVVTPDYGDEDEAVLPFECVEVANICTDLWAYSIADLDHFTDRARTLVASDDYEEGRRYDSWSLSAWVADGADPATLPSDYAIVDVTPGTYRFTHLGGKPDFEEQDWPLIWATVARLDDAPVAD